MKQYYVNINSVEKGPYTINDLKDIQVLADTYVWTEGMKEWEQAINVEELKSLLKITPPPFKPKSNNTIPDKQVETNNRGLTNSEIVGNEVNVKYKCEWCNSNHSEQFLVCSVCHKKRKDIWWDDLRAMTYLITGILVVAIAFFIFYSNKENSDFVLAYGWACVIAIIIGLIFMIVGGFYNQRTKKKLKIKDFD